jgi:hypothetical protein
MNAVGPHVTVHSPSPNETSSAPASIATSISRSSPTESPSSVNTPLCSNMYATLPLAPRFPPYFVKTSRTSPAVRVRLFVSASTMKATPPGPYPS